MNAQRLANATVWSLLRLIMLTLMLLLTNQSLDTYAWPNIVPLEPDTAQSAPTEPYLIKDIYSGAASSFPDRLTNVGGMLFFITTNSNTHYELWKSDSTPTGTVLIKDMGFSTWKPSYLILLRNVGILSPYIRAQQDLTAIYGAGNCTWERDKRNIAL